MASGTRSTRSRNQKVVLYTPAHTGPPVPDMFAVVDEEVDDSNLEEGEVLLRNVYLSLDPSIYAFSLRGTVPGGTVESRVLSVVHASRSAELLVGDVVWGTFGWELFTKLPAALIDRRGQDIRPNIISPGEWRRSTPLSWALSILGVPGLTAWAGLMKVAKVKADDTVYVSSAAGAVGLIAGQIAKALGCRIVGSAGSDEKCRLAMAMGFDACFNYKTAVGSVEPMSQEAVQGLSMELSTCCPRGIDVYFDTVGGPALDAVLLHANPEARIVVCGMTSQYMLNDGQSRYGARFLPLLVEKKITMSGFQVQDFAHLMPQYLEQMTQWIDEDRVHYIDTIIDGVYSVPTAFCSMMQGNHTGKTLVRVSDDVFTSGWAARQVSPTHKEVGCQAEPDAGEMQGASPTIGRTSEDAMWQAAEAQEWAKRGAAEKVAATQSRGNPPFSGVFSANVENGRSNGNEQSLYRNR